MAEQTTKLVSVIIPTFNRKYCIGRAVKSALNQTYEDIEIIIVDDGSKDGTGKYIKSFQDRRIRYVYQENKGVSAARNNGIIIAKGDYIAFLDSDDEWEKSKLEKQIRVLTKDPGLSMVFCGSHILDHTEKVIEKRYCTEEQRGFVFEKLILRNFIPTPTVLMKKSILLHIGMMDESISYGEDWHCWLKVAAFNRIGFVNEKLVKFRRLEDGLTNEGAIGKMTQSLAVINSVYSNSEIKKKYGHLISRAKYYQCLACSKDLMWHKKRYEARTVAFMALKYRPYLVEIYLFILKTYIPESIVQILRRYS